MFTDKLKQKINQVKEEAGKRLDLAPADVAEHRMNICRSCDRLIHITTTCKECGCFMAAKTRLKNVSCPLNKW